MSLFPNAIGTQSALNYPVPLVEKYRPRRLDDFIGLETPRKVLSKFALQPTVSAWAFVGPAGVGKTCMAQAFCEAIAGEFHHIPSQKCDARAIDEVVHQCHFATYTANGFHVVLVDEADRMTQGAQLALLSKLDSTDAPPQTIWFFTCNSMEGLEKPFRSRCRVLEFSSYGMRESLTLFLAKVWEQETGKTEGPDFARMAKDSTNNVRDALNRLEVEILGV